MTFKEKLVKLRKLKGITQDEFASAVGVSRQAVYKWESGQSYPEVSKLLEIKALFNISIDDLLDDNYEVVLPEKQKKRLSASKMRAIEEAVEKAEAELEKPVAVENISAPAIEEEVKAEVTVNASAPEKTEKKAEAEQVKEETAKRGFFSRLFGR